ncbi:MAG: alpha/beta hydrolase [Gemmatimonadetes bacterium]|nr:alpha/beta hydrolase [Gemmatimonadota bacterium]
MWSIRGLLALLLVTCIPTLQAQSARTIKDITFARVDGRDLKLDLYLPEGIRHPPLLVWVHGGAWWRGSKDEPPVAFVSSGFALASVEYRLSGEARFPAQIFDIKAAVRFLRAKATTYGYRVDRIAIGGESAGAHLAALVGVSNGEKELEGSVGTNLTESSSVQAILDYYGASNLQTILPQSTPWGLSVRVPALQKLLGAHPDSRPALAKLASPVTHVDDGDPPLLLYHGDQDPQMPINQAHELQGVYEQHHLKVYFDVLHGGVHGDTAFYDQPHTERAARFLREVLGK